jgi:hypothetical protein
LERPAFGLWLIQRKVDTELGHFCCPLPHLLFTTMANRFRPLSAGLGPLIADLERRARTAQDVTERVRAALPSPDKEHFLSASYKEDVLIVSMDGAAWCSRVRYDHKALIETLHAAGETRVTKIRVRVGRR